VILTGDGGDEMFGGYKRYAAFRRGERVGRAFGPLAPLLGRMAEATGRLARRPRLQTGGRWIGEPWPAYRDALFHFRPHELNGLFREEMLEGMSTLEPVERLNVLWEETSRESTALLWVDEQTYLPDDLLTKMDRATMAHSLEARSPLLDHLLAECCAELEEGLLFEGSEGKSILRGAYTEVLPPEILHREKKGFGVPIAEWMRSELRGFLMDLLVSDEGPLWPWLRRNPVHQLVARLLDGDDRSRLKIWNLLALAGWVSQRGGG
jgi:asparagine synthase (glutamine-hydrolysing)